MNRTPRPRAAARVALVALLAALAAPALAVPAQAAADVTVRNEQGDAQADVTYSTPITVSGRGFQSVAGGFGGIYVLFGWAGDGWRPSEGGTVGAGDYAYVPDAEGKDNAGYQRFVAFPGSDTADAANGGTIAADGTWSTTMMVPGPTFQAADRDGGLTTIDCREVTCGIITIGAHGVTNARNETFTPITFTDLHDEPAVTPTAAPTAQAAPTAPPQDGATSEDEPAATPAAVPGAAPAEPELVADTTGAVPGHVLAFTGRGFAPGEQVVVLLDDGVAAVGPLTVGTGGAFAGLLPLPVDLDTGTHTLVATAATSGTPVEITFAVRPAPAVAADDAAPPAWWPGWPAFSFAVAGLLLLAAAVVWRVRASRRRRADRPGAAAPGPAARPAGPSAGTAAEVPGA